MDHEEHNSVAVVFFFFLIFNFNHGHYWCICSFIFHWSFCTVVIGQCNRTVGCNRTPLTGQLKQPIILSLLCQSPNHRNDHNNHGNDHLSKEKLWHFQNGGIFNKRHCRHWRYLFYVYLFFRKLKWLWLIGIRPSCRPILSVIIRVITDYRPNWTPRDPITTMNQKYNKIIERDWLSPARLKH